MPKLPLTSELLILFFGIKKEPTADEINEHTGQTSKCNGIYRLLIDKSNLMN